MAAAAAIAVHPAPWHLAARLASVIARPLDHALVVAGPQAAVAPDVLRALARHPAFHGPINRAQSRSMGLGGLAVTREFLDRLDADPRARLCTLLVSQPMSVVGEAALAVSAAILHKQVVRIVLKADRDRLRAVLGEDGFEIATREALLFHGPLASLGAGLPLPSVIHPDIEAAQGRRRAVERGTVVLAGLVEMTDPAMGELFRLRIRAAGLASDRDGAGVITDQHGDHIVRLLRRRIRAWSALIG